MVGKEKELLRGGGADTKKECNKEGDIWLEGCDGDCGECIPQVSYQWMPGSDEKTDKWQMVSPTPSSVCKPFGETGEWSKNKQTEDGKFAWNYWRHYKCCLPGKGSHLYTIEIPKICF